jgi:site-specific DNA recombinase
LQRVQLGLAEATFEQKRQLVELLIDRVVVTDEEVEIRYMIPTTKSSEHTRFCHLHSDYFDTPLDVQGRFHQGSDNHDEPELESGPDILCLE